MRDFQKVLSLNFIFIVHLPLFYRAYFHKKKNETEIFISISIFI